MLVSAQSPYHIMPVDCEASEHGLATSFLPYLWTRWVVSKEILVFEVRLKMVG